MNIVINVWVGVFVRGLYREIVTTNSFGDVTDVYIDNVWRMFNLYKDGYEPSRPHTPVLRNNPSAESMRNYLEDRAFVDSMNSFMPVFMEKYGYDIDQMISLLASLYLDRRRVPASDECKELITRLHDFVQEHYKR